MRDQSAYVRKTAVLSCVKMHFYSPETLASSDIVNNLYNMLRDRDPQAPADVGGAAPATFGARGGRGHAEGAFG